ncbi:PhzF family phenazine biosynthesis protein [Novosphingobium sp. 9U]|uniref:PhzF family phenazine biosynthesis protein n=1 Tax=Novosphingobium sp. 9U TaxID=2653158 RepID=UPI0012F2EBC4|nr:PhzF family phenazine biosynthesis protein [Novosphingobium sp. 9U]VWX53521.1 Phenazine biosynthesis protein PhzF [Novosphingobium sp. 9U]
MPTVPYWHVDAFADQPFAGNQAAVMILDNWPEDRVLQAIGAENMFAETAFVVRDASGEADWELRWFTPACEIRLCGHATLASGHVLLRLEPGLEQVTFRTRQAGVLVVRRDGPVLSLGLPAIVTERADVAAAKPLLGAEPVETWRSPLGYNVFLYPDEAAVRALAPDLRGLEALGDDQFIVTAPGTETDVVSRVFVPGGGVDEDSVTGSAHAVLTAFWTRRLGRESFTAYQASQRGGLLTCRIEGDVAWLGGPCVTVVEGRFTF